MLDAGQVGTEMLYYLVGSRDLDGGLMCTASHNPKAYTGAKLVGQGALALSGDSGIGEVRDRIAAGLGETGSHPPGSVQEVSVYEEFQEAALRFIDPAAVKPLKVVVDGGNGMAGPMVGPLLERLGLDLVQAYFEPDGNFPDHEPNPLLPENREFIMGEVVKRGRRPGDRLGRRRRPLLLHRRARRVRGRRLPHRAAQPSRCSRRSRTPPCSTTSGPAGRSPTRPPGRAAGRWSTASATPSSRRGCAPRGRRSAARCPATTTSATSTARTRARCRRC